MIKEVWKYKVTSGINNIKLLEGYKILSCGVQSEQIIVWILINPNKLTSVDCKIYVAMTGEKISIVKRDKFIGTCQKKNGIVMHLFHMRFK